MFDFSDGAFVPLIAFFALHAGLIVAMFKKLSSAYFLYAAYTAPMFAKVLSIIFIVFHWAYMIGAMLSVYEPSGLLLWASLAAPLVIVAITGKWGDMN